MEVVISILSVVFLISTIMPFSKRGEWWIRLFDFPYLQFTVLGFVVLLYWIFVFPDSMIEIGMMMAVLVSLGYRIFIIFPYTSFQNRKVPSATADQSTIKLISGNVYMYNESYNECIDLITQEDPDLFFLVEVNRIWIDQLDKAFNQSHRYTIKHPLENTYGLVLYSKLPLEQEQICFLVEEDVPSIHCIVKTGDNQCIRFYGLHPKPPSPSENESSTPRDAELVKVGSMAKSSQEPVIVAGDMNDVAWSHTTRLFMRVSGLLDPRMGRGFFNTFHAKRFFLRWPLDHFFVSHHFKIASLTRLNNFNSDHFPIAIELSLDASLKAFEAREEASKKDLEEAEDIVAEAEA